MTAERAEAAGVDLPLQWEKFQADALANSRNWADTGMAWAKWVASCIESGKRARRPRDHEFQEPF